MVESLPLHCKQELISKFSLIHKLQLLIFGGLNFIMNYSKVFLSALVAVSLLSGCAGTAGNEVISTIDKTSASAVSQTYSGEITEPIVINSSNDVSITLDNVSYKGESAFITVESAGSLTINVSGDNTIETTGEDSNAIHAKDDIVITGSGNLSITSLADGIHANDDLSISDVTLSIVSGDDGLDVNNSTSIKDAVITITSSDDGMSLGEDDNSAKVNGDLILDNSTITIMAENDGIDAVGEVTTDNSKVNITAGGGSANAVNSTVTSGFGGHGQFGAGSMPSEGTMPSDGSRPDMSFEGGMPQTPPEFNGEQKPEFENGQMPNGGFSGRGRRNFEENSQSDSTTEPSEIVPKNSEEEMLIKKLSEGVPANPTEDENVDFDINELYAGIEAIDNSSETSGKGVKAGKITINSTDFVIDAQDDGFNVDSEFVFNGGTISISTGDDAVHSDGSVVLNSGIITIEKCREGFEGVSVTFNDGEYSMVASDDGINAGGASGDEVPEIIINGGKITIDMGAGDTDAVDANGNIYINGGELNITAQSAFDYDKIAEFKGGKIVVNGEEITEITNQMMGGGMQMGGQRR